MIVPSSKPDINAPTSNKISDETGSKPNSFLLDFGPIAVFVILYNILRIKSVDGALYIAAGVFMVFAVLALVYSKIKHGTVSGMLILTTVIIIITASLAILFKNPVFFYMKPTIVNILFGLGIFIGLALGKNPLKMMMGEAYNMSESAWKQFGVRWALFFFAMSGLNEIIWRNFSESFWANFKLFGFLPLTFVFILSQLPFLMKHSDLKDKIAEAEEKADKKAQTKAEKD